MSVALVRDDGRLGGRADGPKDRLIEEQTDGQMDLLND